MSRSIREVHNTSMSDEADYHTSSNDCQQHVVDTKMDEDDNVVTPETPRKSLIASLPRKTLPQSAYLGGRLSSSSHHSKEDRTFDTLDSIHTNSTLSNSQSNMSWHDASETDFDDSSFASLGSNDDDEEEVYREQQMAMERFTLESTQPPTKREILFGPQSPRWHNRKQVSFRGTLDLIAE